MKPVKSKRLLVHFGFRNGFVVIGTKPKGYWVMAGGSLARQRVKPRSESK